MATGHSVRQLQDYVPGSYFRNTKGELLYVLSHKKVGNLVELEECLTAYDDAAHPVQRMQRSKQWCDENLLFVRGPVNFDSLLTGVEVEKVKGTG